MASETRYYDVTPASTAGLGDWVQIQIDNPPVRPVDGGDIVVTHVESGEVLPHLIVANTAERLRFTVALRSPADATKPQRIRVEISDAGTPHPGFTDWVGGGHEGGSSVGPTILIDDGHGNQHGPTDEWVHPCVMRVPADSWLRFADATERDSNSGSVTHIRIDTPFPADATYGRDHWENPYLLASTDGGETWFEWNASINPLQKWPGQDQWLSDVGFFIDANGNLRCIWRNGAFDPEMRIVTGTCLADATAGALIPITTAPETTGPSELIVAPSFVRHADRVYMFYRRSDGQIYRQESTDEGETFTNQALAIPVSAPSDWVSNGGWAAARKYWHGSVAGPFSDGYYYAAYSEDPTGNANNEWAAIRLFRAPDPTGPWQAARAITLRAGTGIGSVTWYQPCPVETDTGIAIIASGHSGGAYRVTTQDLALGNEQVSEGAAFQFDTQAPNFWSVSSSYAVDHTDRGTVIEVIPEPVDPTGPLAFVLEDYTAPAGDQVDFVLGGGEPGGFTAVASDTTPAQTDSATALFATVTHSASAADTTPAQTDAATVAHQTPEHAAAVSEATPAQIDALLARLAEVVFVASASDATPMQVDGAGGTHHPPAVAVVDDATPAQTDSAAATFGELVHLVTVSDETLGQFDSAEVEFSAPVFAATASDWSPAQVDMATATLIRPAVATVGDSQPMQTDAVSAHYREHAPVGPFRPILTITTIRPRLTVEDA